MSDTQSQDYSRTYRWYVVVLLMCVYACNLADRTLLSVLVEPIKAEFGVSDTVMGFIGGTLFATTYALSAVLLGWLSDRVNRRNLLAICLSCWSLMTIVSGFARNIIHLGSAQFLVAMSEGGGPPSMSSLVSDLFSRERRGFAIAIWFTGVSIGMFIGYSLGAMLAESVGWRTTFVVLGIPGVLLALLVRFTVRETPRGMADGSTGEEPGASGIDDALRFLKQQRALMHVIIGGCLIGLAVMGPTYWLIAFFIRTHEVTLGQAGLYVGLIVGVTGVTGGPLGGLLMDRMGQRDIRWHSWIVALFTLSSVVPMMVLYLSDSMLVTIIACIVWNFLTTGIPVIMLAMINNLAAAQFRGLSISVFLLLFNLIGYGLGSQLVGISSDYIDSAYGLGEDSLRYASLIMVVFAIWGAVHFWFAARHIRQDYETAAKWETSVTPF